MRGWEWVSNGDKETFVTGLVGRFGAGSHFG
jgi:hypothetical protein